MSQYLTASEAAAQLGISLPTLYAYVSRGLIHSETTGADHRARRYLSEDVDRLKARKEQRRNPAKAAETALNWGEPVLESAITLIENGQLYYRGYDAVELAETRTVEEVAGLIWLGELDGSLFEGEMTRVARLGNVKVEGFAPAEMYQMVLSLAASDDLLAYDLTQLGVAKTGARILRMLSNLPSPRTESMSIAHTLAASWSLSNPKAIELIKMALILCADHELNVSSFTARCVASAGSTPYAVVIAGLAALQGYKHGGVTGQIEAFLYGIRTPGEVRSSIAARIRRGETIPGFGHKLYPGGDPRGKALITQTAIQFPKSRTVVVGNAVADEIFALNGLSPTVDFGLVILAAALELPAGSAMRLFALGRVVGWIGQAIEQYDLDTLIRPRARYTGIIPHH